MESIAENLSLNIVLLVVLFRIAAFENQRWVRARQRGMRGQNETVGVFVDLILPLGTLVWYFFLVSFFIDTSFLTVFCLYIIPFVLTFIWGFVSRDNMFIWIISSLLVLPVGFYLIFQTTVFGLL